MTDKTTAENRDLNDLLRAVQEGNAVLPEFQRDFDWGDADVRALLATVLIGWPIGSLLLMEGPPAFFETREVDQAPPKTEPVDDIILDGQQRITSLYQALYDRGPYVYYLRTNLLGDREIDDIEEAIVASRRDAFESNYPTARSQMDADIIPMSALRTPTDFFVWRDSGLAGRSDTDAAVARDGLTELYREFLSGLHNYSVPAIMISKRIQPAAIARIFERVNRTGMQLGTFDLMVAKSYSRQFNLRDEWREARDQYPRLAAFFGDDGLPILNVISLRVHSDVRQKAVLNLSGAAIRDGWRDACVHMDMALAFATTRLGIWLPDMLPYRAALTVLAGISYDVDIESEGRTIEQWYWSTVFGRRFDVASNTRSVADYITLTAGKWDARPISISELDALSASKKTQGAFHRGILNFVASLFPYDPVDEAPLEPAGVEDGVLAAIAPVSLFSRNGVDIEPALHLRTLGFVLAGTGNRRKVAGRANLSSRGLTSQLVDPVLLDGDWDGLLRDRLDRLVHQLRDRYGLDAYLVSEEDAKA